MGKLFSTRQLLNRYPWLDKMRMDALGWICNHGSSFYDHSYRWFTLIAPGARRRIEVERKPFIIALYHGRMVGTLNLRPRERMTILISESRDGEMIARGCLGMGFSVARGSPAKGAVKGTLALLSAAESGNNLVFMVDGPRGPIFSVKPGIVRLASMSGLPIVPWVTSTRHSWVMGSWDRFFAPCWGTPIISILGEPIHVPADAGDDEIENYRLELATAMEKMRAATDTVWPLTR